MVARAELEIRAQIKELNTNLKKTQKELKAVRVESQKTNKVMQQNVAKTNEGFVQMKSHLTALLSVGAFIAIAKRVLDTRVEFEKFNAILKVALGSAKEANKEFKKIQDFASKTPFSVRELTDSFVRLVNQGFKPTTDQLRAMGDLAAAMGKEFIQLTEAIIDAQVGEFERLKEFGIRASKEGNKVTLSFKGMEQQVRFTAEEIQDAIIGFGEMEGVMGSMEAISETLGGQISNLGDSIDELANNLGKMSQSTVSEGISVLSSFINILGTLTEIVSRDRGATPEFITIITSTIARMIPVIGSLVKARQGLGEVSFLLGETSEGLANIAKESEEAEKSFEKAGFDTSSFEAASRELTVVVSTWSEWLEDRDKETPLDKFTALMKEIDERIADDARKALQESLTEIEKLEQEAADESFNISNDLIQKQISDDKKLKDEKIKNHEEIQALLEKDAEAKRQQGEDELIAEEERSERRKQFAGDALNTSIGLLNSLGELQRIKLEEDLKAAGDNEEKKAEIIKAFNLKQQQNAIAQTLISGAEAILKNSAQLGFVPAIPINILQALQTLTQIAVIKAQKFAEGGYEVLKGRRHNQGGIGIPIGEAEDGEGHAVFSREATKKFGKFIPAFVKQINEGNMPGSLMFMEHSVSLDDSKQLEEIKQLLKSGEKEVTFSGGYRIEKRKGSITRIKV